MLAATISETGMSMTFLPGGEDPVADTEMMQAWHYLETGLKNGVPEIKVFEPATP